MTIPNVQILLLITNQKRFRFHTCSRLNRVLFYSYIPSIVILYVVRSIPNLYIWYCHQLNTHHINDYMYENESVSDLLTIVSVAVLADDDEYDYYLMNVSKVPFQMNFTIVSNRFILNCYVKTFWYLTTFTVQPAILDIFWDKHFRVYFLFFEVKMLVPYKCPIVSYLTSNVIKI
jgi:hypothetical protein